MNAAAARRIQVRRLSANRPLVQTTPQSNRKQLSTPLRYPILQTPVTGTQTRGPLDTTASLQTPAEVRWPLVTFLKERGHDELVLREARSCAGSQQAVLSQVLEVEEAISQVAEQHGKLSSSGLPECPDLHVLYELRRQFVLSCLRNLDDVRKSQPIRICLLQSIQTFLCELEPMLERCALTECEPCPVEDVEEPATPTATRTETPAGKASSVCLRSAAPSSGPGDTPLDLVKNRVVIRARVTALKEMCAAHETPVKLEAQKRLTRLTMIPEHRNSTATTTTSSADVTTRNSSTDATDRHSLMPVNPSGGELCLKRNVPSDGTATPLSKRRRTLTEATTAADSQEEENLPDEKRPVHSFGLTLATVTPSEDTTTLSTTAAVQKPVKSKQLKGAKSLLGAKTAPQNTKRYVSRTAVNAKTRRVKEAKSLRRARESQEEEKDGENHVPKNDTRRTRQMKKIEKARDSLFVEKVQSAEEIAASLSVCEDERKTLTCTGSRKQQFEFWLKEFFECSRFRPGQLEAISTITMNDQCCLLVSLPTGAGKSLIYQMSAMYFSLMDERPKITLVICPTIPLLEDQRSKMIVERNDKKCIVSAIIHSGVSYTSVRETLVAISNGLVDILFTTPEQFGSHRLRQSLANVKARPIGLLCVDEAHCLSEWGHSFRPAYQGVMNVAKTVLRIPRILMTTATASRSTLGSIADFCGGDQEVDIFRPLDHHQRKDLSLVVEGTSENVTDCLALIKSSDWKSCKGVILVYAWMKYQAERVAERIKNEMPEEVTLYYHSGLEDDERCRILNALQKGRCRFMVATQALGVGIDALTVSRVIHMNMPAGLEQYTQEIGRCNRAHLQTSAPCHLFLAEEDYRARHQQIASSSIDPIALAATLSQILLADITGSSSGGTEKNKKRKKGDETNALFDLRDHTSAQMKHMLKSKPDRLMMIDSGDKYTDDNGNENQIVVVSLTKKELSRMLGCRGIDDLEVLLTLMQNETQTWPKTRLKWPQEGASEDETETQKSHDIRKQWSQVMRWWSDRNGVVLEDEKGGTQADEFVEVPILRILTTVNIGVEIRCYKDPLENVAEQCYFIQWLSSYWTKASSGVYRLNWLEMMRSLDEHSGLQSAIIVDVDLVEQMLYDIAGEYGFSVRGFSGADRRSNWICVRPSEIVEKTKWSDSCQSLYRKVVNVLGRNTKIQVNRLDTAYVAFKLGQTRSVNPTMQQFIENYFDWDAEVETLDRDDLWSHPSVLGAHETTLPKEANKFYIQTLDKAFSNHLGELEKAMLKHDIEKLVDHLTTHLNFEVRTSGDLEIGLNLTSTFLTSSTVARILTGMTSVHFDYKNALHLPGWKSYNSAPFEIVLEKSSIQMNATYG